MPPKTKDPESLAYMRQHLSKYNNIHIARPFTDTPLPDVHETFNDTLSICIDLEWNNIIPFDKITEVGLVVFPMSILCHCQSPADFPSLLEKFAVYNIRLLETWNLRNVGHDAFGVSFADAEQHSMFARTRFVSQAEVIDILKNFLNNQRRDDRTKRPIVIIGHRFENDEKHLEARPRSRRSCRRGALLYQMMMSWRRCLRV